MTTAFSRQAQYSSSAPGRDRQLVRAPAGQALRRGARVLRDGLLARGPLPQREDLHRAAAHPSRRARRRPGRDPALRAGPGDHALRGRERRARRAPTSSTSTWAAPCRRSARPAPARRCSATRHRGRGRRGRARGQRPAGDRQAAGPVASAATRTASSSRTASSTRPASPAIGFHPRSAQVHHKGAPDLELAAELVAHAARAR